MKVTIGYESVPIEPAGNLVMLTPERYAELLAAESALAGVQRQNEQQRKGLEYGMWELDRLYNSLLRSRQSALASGIKQLKERLATVVAGARGGQDELQT